MVLSWWAKEQPQLNMQNKPLSKDEFMALICEPEHRESVIIINVTVKDDIVIDGAGLGVTRLRLRNIVFKGSVIVLGFNHKTIVSLDTCTFGRLVFDDNNLSTLDIDRCNITRDLTIGSECRINYLHLDNVAIDNDCLLACCVSKDPEVKQNGQIYFGLNVNIAGGVIISPSFQAECVTTSNLVVACQFVMFGIRTIVPPDVLSTFMSQIIEGPGLRR